MNTMAVTTHKAMPTDWREFLALTKPGVMRLVVFTGLCGLLAAPGAIHPVIGFTTILCIAMGAGGAAALNQWWEVEIDEIMQRTSSRPLPSRKMDPIDARDFGIALSFASTIIMGVAVSWLASSILAAAILYYVVIYTIWLKPRTPQNIVIGGGAGAFPPMIGWIAVSGEITAMPLLLFGIIFFWTPPHFWALALFAKSDYQKAGIPMLPVVAGEKSTRLHILVYSIALLPVALAPWLLGLVGLIYGVSVLLITSIFLGFAVPVAFRKTQTKDKMAPEKVLFAYSILYLFLLFGILVVDALLANSAGALQ